MSLKGHPALRLAVLFVTVHKASQPAGRWRHQEQMKPTSGASRSQDATPSRWAACKAMAGVALNLAIHKSFGSTYCAQAPTMEESLLLPGKASPSLLAHSG